MRRLLATVVAVLAAAGALLAFGGQASADDTYAPGIPSSCHIDASALQVGSRVVLRATVNANSTTGKVGKLKVSISTVAARSARARQAGPVVWTRTVRYNGTPVEVKGPFLPRGAYVASMTFTPDAGSEITGCLTNARFRIGGDLGGETDDNGGGGGGGLPNTGGPHLWFLLAGLVLVVAGGGVVGGSRRIGSPA